MNNFTAIIMTPIFIIILLVTYKAVKSAFNFGTVGTFTMSVCVSLLSIIGISRCLEGSMDVILLPYAALAVAICVLLLLSFIAKYFKGSAERFSEYPNRKNRPESKATKQSSRGRNIQKS